MDEKYCEIELKISFNTPAFLGNAYQNGQWRTPPFKALLRQWWRVVKASKDCNDINKIRSDEAILFGSATDDDNKNLKPGRSLLRIKLLDNWNYGSGKNEIDAGQVYHKEVERNRHFVDADLYLGFGAIQIKDNEKVINPYISPDEENTLWLGFPSDYKEELIETIQLIAWFGTIGSRSRNGWGSIRIESTKLNGNDIEIKNEIDKKELSNYAEDYNKLLNYDWAKKIGKDKKNNMEQLLIWKTNPQNKYENVIKDLAKIKIAFRTHFDFKGQFGFPTKRHTISYPITHHDFLSLKNSRKPNQLRFKVFKAKDKYYGLIFHLPCMVSETFFKGFRRKVKDYRKNEITIDEDKFRISYKKLEKEVWSEIYDFLDNKCDSCSRL